jgi:hypothetical protein
MMTFLSSVVDLSDLPSTFAWSSVCALVSKGEKYTIKENTIKKNNDFLNT